MMTIKSLQEMLNNYDADTPISICVNGKICDEIEVYNDGTCIYIEGYKNEEGETNMTLYEFLKIEQCDFDTYDTVFDICVTVCEPYISDKGEEEYYDKFYNFIIKHIEVVEKTGECTCICKWYDFIKNNIEVFRKAANDMWYAWLVPDDEEDLIYEWIKDIHLWLAGYVSEVEYKVFMKNYADKIK